MKLDSLVSPDATDMVKIETYSNLKLPPPKYVSYWGELSYPSFLDDMWREHLELGFPSFRSRIMPSFREALIPCLFFYILLAWLGSLSDRIKSTYRCIIYKRYTRNKSFHQGNHKAVIRSIQQLDVSPPFVSLFHVNLRVWGVYRRGREPPYLYLWSH